MYDKEIPFTGTDREVSILEPHALNDYAEKYTPSWIVNCLSLCRLLIKLICNIITTDKKNYGTYHFSGENEWENIKLVHSFTEVVAAETRKDKDYYKKLDTSVKDRPGHDRRYAINRDKLKNALGWRQSVTFEEGLKKTVRWYLENRPWIENIKSLDYIH